MSHTPSAPEAGDASAPGQVSVLCRPTADGFACEVVVGRDPGATRHSVTVSQEELARLAPGHYDPERLVTASFSFLLAREPREAILPVSDSRSSSGTFRDTRSTCAHAWLRHGTRAFASRSRVVGAIVAADGSAVP